METTGIYRLETIWAPSWPYADVLSSQALGSSATPSGGWRLDFYRRERVYRNNTPSWKPKGPVWANLGLRELESYYDSLYYRFEEYRDRTTRALIGAQGPRGCGYAALIWHTMHKFVCIQMEGAAREWQKGQKS